MAFEPHLDANLLAAWIEGGLPETQHRRLLRHLSACDACRAWAVCAQTAGGALPQLTAKPPTPLLSPPPAHNSFWRWRAPLGVAASAALLAAVVWRIPGSPVTAPAAPRAARVPAMPVAATAAPPLPRPHLRTQAPDSAPPPRSVRPTRAAAALPALAPAPAIEAAVQPHIDFSPLLTGFQDQPMLPMARSALAAWDGAVNPTGGATATPAVAVTLPAASPASAGATAWPFAAGFAGGVSLNQGPLAPSVASGLGWAISRGGEVLRSIGAGLWQAVPLVPGVHFRALAEVGNSIWAGGRADQLFFSPDHGEHWRTVRLPKLGDHPAPLKSISFYDTHHGIVMSQDGRVWITSDGGLSWTAE